MARLTRLGFWTFVALLCSSRPTWADFQAGRLAYDRGDYTSAYNECDAPAHQGNADCQNFLGVLHFQGHGVARDEVQAVQWYRRAAEQGHGSGQSNLGVMYATGRGVERDDNEAVKWFQRSGAQGTASGQNHLGAMYAAGRGVPKDDVQAVEWYRRAAEQGYALAQANLGFMYSNGRGVPKDDAEAAKWNQRAAELGNPAAQANLANAYGSGRGLPKDPLLSYMWYTIAIKGASGDFRDQVVKRREAISRELPPALVISAQQMADRWKPRPQARLDTPAVSQTPPPVGPTAEKKAQLEMTGTGFIVSRRGHALTNAHVVEGCSEVRTRLPLAESSVTPVVATDGSNDLALLALPSPPPILSVASFREGRGIRQGDTIVALGFPLHGLLASGANLTTGNVSALAGVRDDARYLQITAPVQPGNSGGPLLDQSGNVVGVVVGKLDALKVARAIGDIPQNVNFAVNANVARAFLDANGVDYALVPSTTNLQAADIGERAKKFTVVVQCWK